MTLMHRRRSWRPALVVVSFVLLASSPAWADWIGEYWPLWVGNAWTYENVDVPGDIYTEAVFEFLVYEGDAAVKLGSPAEYRVIGNTGHVITVYAEMEDGELVDFAQSVVVGEFGDGTVFQICLESPCDTNLIRDWEAIDPALRSAYGIDPGYDDLVLVVSYDRGHPPNAHNVAAASNLPVGVTPPAGAVTALEWYQRGLGMVAVTDVDAASGSLYEFYQLIDVHIDVPDRPDLPALATLAPSRPNPCNPRTTIAYTLTRSSATTLEIYDLAGRLVRTLATKATRSAGTTSVTWDGDDDGGRPQPSGTYICRLRAGAETHARRLSLIR